MEVVDTTSTGHEAVRRAAEHQPDIILMDIHMPDMDGIQAAWLVSGNVPNGAVIMVTSEERIDFIQKAMATGTRDTCSSHLATERNSWKRCERRTRARGHDGSNTARQRRPRHRALLRSLVSASLCFEQGGSREDHNRGRARARIAPADRAVRTSL